MQHYRIGDEVGQLDCEEFGEGQLCELGGGIYSGDISDEVEGDFCNGEHRVPDS